MINIPQVPNSYFRSSAASMKVDRLEEAKVDWVDASTAVCNYYGSVIGSS